MKRPPLQIIVKVRQDGMTQRSWQAPLKPGIRSLDVKLDQRTPPKPRYLSGNFKHRMQLLDTYLAQNFPRPHPAEWAFVRNDQQFEALCARWGVAPYLIGNAQAVYLKRAGEIYVSPYTTDQLESRSMGTRARGLRTLLHEHYHSLRLDPRAPYPIEEGGAELFANLLLHRLTGMSGEDDAISDYAPLAKGVDYLARAARRGGDPAQWLYANRRAADLEQWLRNELTPLGVPQHLTDVLEYTAGTEAEWLRDVLRFLAR